MRAQIMKYPPNDKIMRTLMQSILIGLPVIAWGQNGITFEIEKLSKPEQKLKVHSCDDIYKNLIHYDANSSKWKYTEPSEDFQHNILAKSQTPDSLVSFGYHPFFNGMYKAYADHRPFVLSPDMIWLLISQGFARHVHTKPEVLRKYFVPFSSKKTLVVRSDNDLTQSHANWSEIFPQITTQIGEYTGPELINTLTSNFSTTSEIEKIASEITIMESMEPYFEYEALHVVCGIPMITLLGTTEDWQKIIDKTKILAQYDLKWWTREIDPLLKQFVKASKGDVNETFWRNMFKYHTQKKYGAPKIIDGWIVKFFPYDKKGKRNDLKKLLDNYSLPEEMVKVDFKYIESNGVHTEELMLEIWAGFIGLEQNPETFSLTPKISWMVRKKEINPTSIDPK
jgi:hypothetical protein